MPKTTFGERDVGNALFLLTQAAEERRRYREQIPVAQQEDTDEETDSNSPLFDQFCLTSGYDGILKMTNFSPPEFHALWFEVCDHVSANWNVGRGKKYNKFVMEHCKKKNMDQLSESNRRFTFHPYALYATVVTFQQTNRPSGNLQEAKVFYSGKHKLYGYKVEVSVLPIGIAISCTSHYPGSYADLEIFRRNIEFHQTILKKSHTVLEDQGLLHEAYPNHWAVLLDKGYQGTQDVIRGIHPIRKKPNARLSQADVTFNRNVSSDRIIVENYFGRLCSLWEICSRKYRWSEALYDPIFKLCVALTNYHIEKHPLRNEDLEYFTRRKNEMMVLSEERVRKRQSTQQRYRDNRRLRLSTGSCFASVSSPDCMFSP